MNHTDAGKRHDFVLLFEVTNGNPNGDPDAGNMPRTDPETMHGLVTDVALKRKVRDYVGQVLGEPIFIQSRDALNTLIARAFRDTGVDPVQVPLEDEALIEWFESNEAEGFALEVADGRSSLVYGGESPRERDIEGILLAALGEGEEQRPLREKVRPLARRIAAASKERKIGTPEREQARDRLCRVYFDIRMFGAVLSTGLNAGQVRGPVQVTFGKSIDPIAPLDLSITRQARTTSARMQTGTTEMGRKPMVPYGLYRAHGFVSPALAAQTGVTDGDLEKLWEALCRMFEFDRSAARGEMATRGLYVFTHESPRGNAPAHRLFERVRVRRQDGVRDARAFGDYLVEFDDQNLPDGISVARLEG